MLKTVKLELMNTSQNTQGEDYFDVDFGEPNPVRVVDTVGDRAKLIECLYRGYKTLGFDTDGDRDGAEMLSRMGLGGGNLEAFIGLMDRSFKEQRKDHDSACGLADEEEQRVPEAHAIKAKELRARFMYRGDPRG